MRSKAHVPGSRTLMPIVICILQENGGALQSRQVLYAVMFKLNLPQKLFKKACKEVSFSGVYLRKIGALKPDSKRGEWVLSNEYMHMSFDESKKATYEKYDVLLERK